MNKATTSETSIRRSVTVAAAPERAFDVFTRRLDSWWPRSHHIGAADMAEAVLEPRAGGRWYERSVDGAECDWGEVLVWSPPERLVLAWRIGGDWKHHPELTTEVEVTFTPLDGGRTRLDLEHRGLEAFGDLRDSMTAQLASPNGWGGLLELFREQAEA